MEALHPFSGFQKLWQFQSFKHYVNYSNHRYLLLNHADIIPVPVNISLISSDLLDAFHYNKNISTPPPNSSSAKQIDFVLAFHERLQLIPLGFWSFSKSASKFILGIQLLEGHWKRQGSALCSWCEIAAKRLFPHTLPQSPFMTDQWWQVTVRTGSAEGRKAKSRYNQWGVDLDPVKSRDN